MPAGEKTAIAYTQTGLSVKPHSDCAMSIAPGASGGQSLTAAATSRCCNTTRFDPARCGYEVLGRLHQPNGDPAKGGTSRYAFISFLKDID
jgi:hypothetical protein